jgi:dTDP-glucose pyrophosphorylase
MSLRIFVNFADLITTKKATMKQKPTLLILAAGIGSRYGGLKQLDAVGPSGEAIIDYSIYDALQAGFGKVVFLIRKDLEDAFRERFGKILEGKAEVAFAYQELDMLPEGYTVPEGREKPWGTGHAVWCARNHIDGPFAVINADDFYGRDAYKTLAEAMQNNNRDHIMVAYHLKNTLSKHGHVSRGVCTTDDEGYLVDVEEHTKIFLKDGSVVFENNGELQELDSDLPVSMNFWGFLPSYFDWLDRYFTEFLDQHGEELKSEYFIPTVVNHLISSGQERVKVLTSNAQWFGVTYREDKEEVMQRIAALTERGVYPAKLWR